ncbi:hypothetical protein [Miltoncostaea marina]|uniref:hypothetical protein n=1 Tax=Miltoncostaea marina TaxID=2843215 RepID=UPI001C3D2814|nr:hypothetical protein [Miltoncostaea marina]
MTIIWLIVWFVADRIGDREPLLFDPVNVWTGLLLAAIALDLGAAHATSSARGGGRGKG